MPAREITDATDITQIKRDEPNHERIGVLVVESPPELIGKEFVADSAGIIGRSSSATIVIPEKSVSRKHLFYEFNAKSQRIYIKDLNSTNSTFVNGTKVISAYIKPGDRIRLGKVVLRFDLRTRAEHVMREKIRKQATYDHLTGLLNRTYLEHEIRRLISDGERFTIVFLDLDNFKEINDTYGHQKGDEILKKFSSILRSSTRETDIVGRFGGDEMILVIRGANTISSELIVSRIVEKLRANFKDVGELFGFSYGISEFPQDGDSLEELIKKADERLYENKRRKKKF